MCLDLDRNKLRSIAGISKLCNLKKLILSKNEIVDFPDEIQSLVRLEKLELNQNQIRVIPEGVFCHLPRLKHLRLNNNRLSALPRDLAACRGSLQYLNISNNLFRTFPQPVLQLACLQELHVQNNALRQLPRELFQGQSLKMVKASGNPLREPPSEVCAGGIQQIQNYFNQLQHSACHPRHQPPHVSAELVWIHSGVGEQKKGSHHFHPCLLFSPPEELALPLPLVAHHSFN
uniref:Uncharacterized protein n=1 Tax=Falco tinnunculus TaxID=100819 RepID=A0A8C4UVI2_FALTI